MSPVLGFDTATPDTAVALLDGEAAAERTIAAPDGGRPAHARDLLPAVWELVEQAGGWGAIERIAAGVGPGSFTGLRVGVATARALAQARGIGLAAVTTTAALVAGIDALAGVDRLAVIDARRSEVFVALWRAGEVAPGEPLVTAPGELSRLLQTRPGTVAAGDGAVRFRQELEAAGIEVLPDDHRSHRLSALHICRLGESGAPLAPAELKPLYLRRPDAERWLERDHGN